MVKRYGLSYIYYGHQGTSAITYINCLINFSKYAMLTDQIAFILHQEFTSRLNAWINGLRKMTSSEEGTRKDGIVIEDIPVVLASKASTNAKRILQAASELQMISRDDHSIVRNYLFLQMELNNCCRSGKIKIKIKSSLT